MELSCCSEVAVPLKVVPLGEFAVHWGVEDCARARGRESVRRDSKETREGIFVRQ